MSTLPKIILEKAASLPEGGILSPKEFLHLGKRPAIDKAFSRLSNAGMLIRVSRGAYTAPVKGKFGSRTPSPDKLVLSLANKTGETLVPHGASDANSLGLTQQVPIRQVYLTSGKTRTLNLGKSEVHIKRAPKWMLALGSRPAGAAIRAIDWVGPAHVSHSLYRLRNVLPTEEWQALINSRSFLPSWMAKAIGTELIRE